jgi:hypothetical protein
MYRRGIAPKHLRKTSTNFLCHLGSSERHAVSIPNIESFDTHRKTRELHSQQTVFISNQQITLLEKRKEPTSMTYCMVFFPYQSRTRSYAPSNRTSDDTIEETDGPSSPCTENVMLGRVGVPWYLAGRRRK